VLWWDRETAGAGGGTSKSSFIILPRPPAYAVSFTNAPVRSSHVLRCAVQSLISEATRGGVQERAPLWQESRQSRRGASSSKFNLLLQVALFEVVLVIPGRQVGRTVAALALAALQSAAKLAFPVCVF
jgi:hypothetical protein